MSPPNRIQRINLYLLWRSTKYILNFIRRFRLLWWRRRRFFCLNDINRKTQSKIIISYFLNKILFIYSNRCCAECTTKCKCRKYDVLKTFITNTKRKNLEYIILTFVLSTCLSTDSLPTTKNSIDRMKYINDQHDDRQLYIIVRHNTVCRLMTSIECISMIG